MAHPASPDQQTTQLDALRSQLRVGQQASAALAARGRFRQLARLK